MATEQRVDRLDESINGLRSDMNARLNETNTRLDEMSVRIGEMNTRVNVQLQVTVGLWATTMIGVVATLAAVLFKG